jgi:nucleoside-diphosphate-sugar epimerase
MKVLVTGANGLLGHHVVMELLKRSHNVSIIVRDTQNIFFDKSAVEIQIGNFLFPEILRNAAAGCDAIIHIAAVTSTHLLHYDDYQKINVEGTATVLKVMDELKINTLVYVSTANTIGFGEEKKPATEESPIQFPFSKSFYAHSKLEAEKLVLKASEKPNRHIVIINPTFLIGAYDTKPTSGKLMLMGYKKSLFFIPTGGKNFVPVNDVAQVVCNALIEGKNGEKYLASGVNLSFFEFYKIQSRVGDYKQNIIVIPDFFLEVAGLAGDMLRKFGIQTEICSMNLQQLLIQEYYSNEKAKNELNLKETNLETAINEALNWFNEHGMT